MLIECGYARAGRHASREPLQGTDLIPHLDDHVVQEAQARQAGLYLLRFEHPFKLEKLHGIARADSESVYPAPSSPG